MPLQAAKPSTTEPTLFTLTKGKVGVFQTTVIIVATIL